LEFVVHLIFVPRYRLHAKALVISECLCDKADLDRFPDNVKSYMEKKYVKECEIKLRKPKCKKRLTISVVNRCTIEKVPGESKAVYAEKCRAESTCLLERTDDISDFEYLVKCRAAQMVTNLSIDVNQTAEDGDDSDIALDEAGADWD